MLPKCTRTCSRPSRNSIRRSQSNFLFFGSMKSGKEGRGGKPPFLQRGTVVSGVTCTGAGTVKCSFQGCVPTRSSGLRRTCWVGRLNSHHLMAESVLAAMEPPCLLPPSPGDPWSPEPLQSSCVELPCVPQLHPCGLSLSVWALLGLLHRHLSKLHHCLLSCCISTRVVSRCGRWRSYYRIDL